MRVKSRAMTLRMHSFLEKGYDVMHGIRTAEVVIMLMLCACMAVVGGVTLVKLCLHTEIFFPRLSDGKICFQKIDFCYLRQILRKSILNYFKLCLNSVQNLCKIITWIIVLKTVKKRVKLYVFYGKLHSVVAQFFIFLFCYFRVKSNEYIFHVWSLRPSFYAIAALFLRI